jgi:pyrroline-5-carboxylate reductase
MSPLANSTIATVGSGVMAEAMIAGMLRGKLVEPSQVVASHPRPERREHLEREYGVRTVASNVEAVDGADVILLGIKPQMLAKVGREIGPHCIAGQLVLSVLAGATTAALVGMLGHDQVVRSMPNTPGPPRQGDDRLVRHARDDRGATRPGGCSARRPRATSSRSTTRRWSRWRPRSPAPARPYCPSWSWRRSSTPPSTSGSRVHIAHDLVIETLEGSTLFAKQSGMHPAELRNMVTSPGGTSARPSTSSNPGASGPSVRGRLGGLSPDGRARRPARGVRRPDAERRSGG